MLDKFVFESSKRPYWAAVLLAPLLTAFYYATGALTARYIPTGYGSSLELVGQTIMFIVLPTYLISSLVFACRFSARIAAHLEGHYGVSDLRASLNAPGSLPFIISIGVAIVFAVTANVSPHQIRGALALDPIHASIMTGNILIWSLVGSVLCWRYSVAQAFRHFAEQVDIDLFDLEPIKPIARNGLADVLIVVGAMSLTALQSIDAQFRIENYGNAAMVAIPAMIALFFLPIYPLHRRLLRMRGATLVDIDAAVRTARRKGDMDITSFELHLQHRDRIATTATWPMDFSMLFRLMFYIVIPPLAWVGAALVEMMVNAMVSGG